MLTQHRKPICLSLMSYDLPLWSVVETDATLYQKDQEQFHLLLTEPLVQDFQSDELNSREASGVTVDLSMAATPRLLWLEISPYRVIMTMQGNGQFSYRHFWEQGVYGISRYWLQSDSLEHSHQLRLRNFTRSLTLQGRSLPDQLRIEYELWAGQLQLGHYVINLDILN
ncbi:MAG: hypothetical protein HC769_10920 [Cyanobacteria bacterium CRU_2_1]|nr:hypothetical protein [Hydrococcus sp. RU_2_2]NJR59308.1 hypothetical protein [Cyanobacteria bacterium CRU_2_1]